MTIPFQPNGDGLGARIETMRARHRRLDQDVMQEQRRPQPDAARLQTLKRQRLRAKEELGRYQGLLRTVSRPGPVV